MVDENRYRCSSCDSLQDATRYTVLRNLPPVLHISLLRFVYDVASNERKKSKHSIKFPPHLEMGKYLQLDASSVEIDLTKDSGEIIYELQGVLVHKGTSAYHGHYEAQVYDAKYVA